MITEKLPKATTKTETAKPLDHAPELLKITLVEVFPIKDFGKTKAVARIVLADQLQLKGFRVRDGAKGLYVEYPTDPAFNIVDYHTIYYPVIRDLRENIDKMILQKYEQVLREDQSTL